MPLNNQEDKTPTSVKTGVLLLNLGTPEATDTASIRRYLREFLWDPRVIESNRFLWWFILNGIVLTTRPQKTAEAYKQIWNTKLNESPLKTITRNQTETLAERFSSDENIIIDWAMRYGFPSIKDKIKRLSDEGCEKIILFPLYPQYSATTTASALDKCFETLQNMRKMPAITTIAPYYDHPLYIHAVVERIRVRLANLEWKPDCLLVSFHGLPVAYCQKGDPYQKHCEKTHALLQHELANDVPEVILCYQSLFGREEWLKPYLSPLLEKLAAKGKKNIVIVSPGFASDCVETLEELAIAESENFIEAGGENVSVVPCINHGPNAITLYESLIRAQL